MKWLHLTAFTLFQPHERLQQLLLVFLIVSDPLRLGPSWPLGATAHGRLPQHKRGDPLEESPICPSRRLKIGAAQLQWIYFTCSGLCNSELVQHLFWSALCTSHILDYIFATQVPCTDLLIYSWLGRWFSCSVWLSIVYSVQCFRKSCSMQGRNKRVARKYKKTIPITISHSYHYHHV